MQNQDSFILNLTSNQSNFDVKKKKNKKTSSKSDGINNQQKQNDDYDFEEFDKINLNKNLIKKKFTKYDGKGKYVDKREEGPRQVVSSLFQNNPEIPHVDLVEVKSKSEKVFSHQSYSQMNLHPHLVACLKDKFGIEKTTNVQEKTIPMLLKGSDALVKSVTGSGKTLAYAIPIIQDLQSLQPKITRKDGIHALIVTPTRELAIQSFESFLHLSRTFSRIVPGYLIGGEKKKSEKVRIRKGINILITTPGRLIDHIEHTSNLNFSKVKWFVIDEADRLFEQGFEEAITKIVNHLKEQIVGRRQTVLLSATLTREVERLAGMSLIEPTIIDMSDKNMKNEVYALPKKLSHHFMIVPGKLRLISLITFIINKCSDGNMKALIFMSTQDVVDFHYTLFHNILNPLVVKSGLSEIGFFHLHGNMEQSDRVKVFHKFRSFRNGILICTDVAARGLDLPEVDWILQFSCTAKPFDYVHRVGRTARIGKQGDALQFILPSETKYLQLLQTQLAVNLNEMNTRENIKGALKLKIDKKVTNLEEYANHIQLFIENRIYQDDDLLGMAKKAYLSYVRAYASYPKVTREVLPFKDLHLGHVAKSFCLRESPRELGATGFRFKHTNNDGTEKHEIQQNMFKRKRHDVPLEFKISEFDSGFDQVKKLKKLKKS